MINSDKVRIKINSIRGVLAAYNTYLDNVSKTGHHTINKDKLNIIETVEYADSELDTLNAELVILLEEERSDDDDVCPDCLEEECECDNEEEEEEND